VDILYKGNPLTTMKTAMTKSCHLYMKECTNLFYHLKNKKKRSKKLMNSRNELYGRCSYRTRFLQLAAVGNGGADEA